MSNILLTYFTFMAILGWISFAVLSNEYFVLESDEAKAGVILGSIFWPIGIFLGVCYCIFKCFMVFYRLYNKYATNFLKD